MTKRKMPAALLAGLILLLLAGCGADKVTPNSDLETESHITETVTASKPETDTESDLPAAETTAEKEKAESAVTSAPVTNTETKRPAESPTQPTTSPKATEVPKATEPLPTAPTESQPAETTPSTPTAPPTEPPAETEPSKGFTEADHDRIVSEVKAYAESYKSKGFTFEWSDSLEFGWDVGWMGTPRISRDGVDGTVKTLKHHVDLIYKTGTDPANGVTADSVLYRVVQIEIDGGIAYAVLYG